jgi:hypothetical protein
MRASLLSSVCLLSGCELISGLSGLTVDGGQADDTGVDGSGIDAPVMSDGAVVDVSEKDASDEVAVEAGGACEYDGGDPQCFGATCLGEPSVCCIGLSGPQCIAFCTAGAISLGCTSPDDCAESGGRCCASNLTGPDSGACPYVMQGSSLTSSTCTQAACKGTLLCVKDTDCSAGDHCRMGTASTAPTIRFGICLPF